DSNPQLSSCCQLLELIFRKGLQQPVLALVHRDYWHCLEQLPQLDSCGSPISLALEQTSACKKLLTPQGKGRYFLRLALKRRILGSVVQHLLHTTRLLEVCEVYELVPCRELGMVLRYLGGRVFVLDLIEGSQAQVDRFVLPGDIIDEINGVSLRNASNGQAGVVLARFKGSPLSLRVLRWRADDGAVYQPVVKLLQALKQENPSLQLISRPQQQCRGYGGKEVLQHGIPLVLEQNQPSKVQHVGVACLDILHHGAR
uniref:PDZ domain-containing protein n=1 Tax=Scleropages formosus TaxID=113540 RepID=A0A8C9R4L1_SCLFO